LKALQRQATILSQTTKQAKLSNAIVEESSSSGMGTEEYISDKSSSEGDV